MKILVDADACPVVKIIEQVSREFHLELILVCDTSHVLSWEYAQVVVVEKGADSADFKLIEMVKSGDLIVTQDYGVAAMALGKGAFALHQDGRRYTDDCMDQMLFERFLSKKARRASSRYHGKGPRRRTGEDDLRFETELRKLLGEQGHS